MGVGSRGNRTRNKSLTILGGGIMERARKLYGLPSNPVRDVEKLYERYDATSFAFYSPEEVHALVRAAASEQDAIALRWRDVDFPRSAIRVAGSYGRREHAQESGSEDAQRFVDEMR